VDEAVAHPWVFEKAALAHFVGQALDLFCAVPAEAFERVIGGERCERLAACRRAAACPKSAYGLRIIEQKVHQSCRFARMSAAGIDGEEHGRAIEKTRILGIGAKREGRKLD